MQQVGVHMNIRFAEDTECMDIVIPAGDDFVVDMTVGLVRGVVRPYKTGPCLLMACHRKLLFIEKLA